MLILKKREKKKKEEKQETPKNLTIAFVYFTASSLAIFNGLINSLILLFARANRLDM